MSAATSSSAGGHFHRRWGSAGSSSATSRSSLAGANGSSLSSTVEPSTYGTSWNSVRWNKPVTPGFRSQSSRIAATFEREKPSYYLSSSSSVPRREISSTADKYLKPAAKTAAHLASMGPSVSSRASRFDSTLSSDKYRSEARDLISKYTSKERPSTANGYYSRHFEPQKLSVPQDTFTSPRTSSYSSSIERDGSIASRYSSGRDYGSYRSSASITPTRSTGSRYSETRSITSPGPSSSSHTLRQERPWRQRMAEGARVRAVHGEDVSSAYLASRATRKTSIGRGETDDHLSSSISALRSYVAQPAGYRSRTSSIEARINGRLSRDHSRESIGVPTSASLVAAARKELAEVEDNKAMTRSYSPIRSKEPIALIPRFPTADIAEMVGRSRKEGLQLQHLQQDTGCRGVSVPPKEEKIVEEEERDKDRERKRSVRGRSEARILSRQSSIGGSKGGSSDEDYEREKEDARRKRRASRVRRSRTRDLRDLQIMEGERATSKADGEITPTVSIGREEEVGSPGPLSPRMGGKLSRSASAIKKMVPTKKQSFKSPCLVEVGGPSTTVVTTPLTSPAAAAAATGPLSPTSSSVAAANMSYDEFDGDTDEPDDESQYNAVTRFKPAFKPKVKPSKPVPGMWKKEEDHEENISKNKTIERCPDMETTSIVWSAPIWLTAKKTIRVKPKAVIKKEKEAAKEVQREAEKKRKEEEKKAKEESEKRKKEEEKKIKEEEKKMKKEEEKKAKKEEEKKKKEKRIDDVKCSITLDCPRERGSVGVETKRDDQRRESISGAFREKRPKPVEISIEKIFKGGRKEEKRAEKKWMERCAPTTTSTVSLHCAQSSSSDCELRETIDRPEREGERQAAAKVHVISGPIDDVTMSRVRLRVRAALKEERKRQSLPLFSPDPSDADEKSKRNTVSIPELEEGVEALSRSTSERDTRAAIILNEMRVAMEESQDPSFHVNDSSSATGAGPLVLPDQSILEEYVKRKRGQLEALSRPSSSLDPPSILPPDADSLISSFPGYRPDSPAESTCSDLLPAPEVRIFSRSPRQHATRITSPPSRHSSCSRLSSVEAPTPTPSMLDALTPMQQSSPLPGSAAAAGYNPTPGFLRHGGKAVTLTAKPLPFDTPKTLFEATLQNQANRIRKASLVHQDSTASTHSLDDQMMQRSGLISSFNASLASNQPRPHERYAAHLPHRTGEQSGRTSAASIDSVQSGVLDAASKHVDSMIDQARFKHQAHRSKFKEAIDYLDNIFEDLKKEVDPSAPSTANASPGPARSVNAASRKTSASSMNGLELQQQLQPVQHMQQGGSSGAAAVKHALQREAMQKAANSRAAPAAAVATAQPNGNSHYYNPSTSSHSNSLPNRSQRHRQPVQQQPLQPIQLQHTQQQQQRQQPQPFTTKEPSPVEMSIRPVPKKQNGHPEDLEVSETLVLPRKTDKLDFTRRWLHDDLSGFTKAPPPMIGEPNGSMYSDPDEHSLGSCSAEVAAINNTKQQKRKESKSKAEKVQQQQQLQHPPEKKLAPYRPQPVYGQPTSNGTGARFPVDISDPSHLAPNGSGSLSRVASYDRLSERMQSRHSEVWRAASQEPYQTLGSSSRFDDARPSPASCSSAFGPPPPQPPPHNGMNHGMNGVNGMNGMNGGHYNGFQRGQGTRGSLRSLPDAGLIVGKMRGGHPSTYYPESSSRDPAMAIDALVAELELNTDQNGNNTDKRRSFPTAGLAAPPVTRPQPQPVQHMQQPQPRVVPATSAPAHQAQMQQQQRYAAAQSQRPVQQQQPGYYQAGSRTNQQQQQQMNGGSLGRSKTNGHHHPHHHHNESTLDEVTHMLQAVTELPAEKPKKNGGTTPFAAAAAAAAASRPFDTINQERINPSRVEAIQNMFESRKATGPPSGYGTGDWRNGKKSSREEETGYYDVSEYSTGSMKAPRPSPPPHRVAAPAAAVRHSPCSNGSNQHVQQQQMAGVFPQHVAPLGRNGSAGSSQNGGYYSSNSSCGPTTSYHQSGSARRQSISSRAPSIEDEDDGFYDNIGIYGSMTDDRRYSRGSELGDTVSVSSARLPPSSSSKPTRIGSFLSKIGARSSGSSMMRQPGTAASLVSLNKVAMEPPVQQRGSLMKSSSLSNDPWRKEVIEQGAQGKRGSSQGLGARLKNSLFGSKKRLN